MQTERGHASLLIYVILSYCIDGLAAFKGIREAFGFYGSVFGDSFTNTICSVAAITLAKIDEAAMNILTFVLLSSGFWLMRRLISQ